MLTLYNAPISPNCRRVWITLLEKQIPFELVNLELNGDQFQPEFMAISPFHHIPVLVDDGFSIVESLAILDYIEAKHPTPAMLPQDAKALAIVRMVELVTVNELLPGTNPLVRKMIGFARDEDLAKLEQAIEKSNIVLQLFERLLGNDTYFGGSEQLTLADIVAGTVVQWLPELGVPLDAYPQIKAWCDRLMQRPSWQTTQPTPEEMETFKSRTQTLLAQNH